jgi:hypothetical protein
MSLLWKDARGWPHFDDEDDQGHDEPVGRQRFNMDDHRRTIDQMDSESAPHFQQAGFKHDDETGEWTHPIEGGFNLHGHSVNDAATGEKYHRIRVSDPQLLKHIEDNSDQLGGHYNEFSGIHPDLMHDSAVPASVKVSNPENIGRAVKGLLRNPNAQAAMRGSMQLRKQFDSGDNIDRIANGMKNHVPYHVNQHGEVDSESSLDKHRKDMQDMMGDDWERYM